MFYYFLLLLVSRPIIIIIIYLYFYNILWVSEFNIYKIQITMKNMNIYIIYTQHIVKRKEERNAKDFIFVCKWIQGWFHETTPSK